MSNQPTSSNTENGAAVQWRRRSADEVPTPIVRRVPYLECKLEHPDLEPTGLGEQFFPDAVPYDLAGSERVFYWRPALAGDAAPATTWLAAVATTDDLRGIDAFPVTVGPLVDERDGGVNLVVDGTIGGDTTTGLVESYSPPDVAISDVSTDSVEIRVDGGAVQVDTGERRRITVDERRITPVAGDEETTTVVPELVIRYPGRRELHHPEPGTRLFPSFGLDLDDIPPTVDVPTVGGELDHDALADQLGVGLADRPYPERVLWQAFAYTAFDPHADRTPELAQLRTGHIVLANPPANG